MGKHVVLGMLLLFFLTSCAPVKNAPDSNPGIFIPNEDIIDGFYETNLNLSNDTEVFRYVFSNLKDEVIVYPTENYYYFRFPYAGKVIWGALALSATERDNGTIGFGYSEHSEDTTNLDGLARIGGGKEFSEKDGIIVKKINDFKYSVAFEGKTVVFNLYDIGLNLPKKANLTEDEIFVGPVFDEAGMKFFLIYNEAVPHVYLVLNEDGYVPETFAQLTNKIVIGERTGFAFYVDDEYNRKILVGVKGEHTLKNDWYDGPHDQMPDNYVYTGQIPDYQKYIENAYRLKGKIDKYGNYLDEKGVRVAVAPYKVYFSEKDLYDLQFCEHGANLTRSEFYECITTQVYDVPEEVENKMYGLYAPYEPGYFPE